MSTFFNCSSSVRPLICLAVLFCICGVFNSTTKVHIKRIIITKSNNSLIVEEKNTRVSEVGEGAQLVLKFSLDWQRQHARQLKITDIVPHPTFQTPYPILVFSHNISSSNVLYNLLLLYCLLPFESKLHKGSNFCLLYPVVNPYCLEHAGYIVSTQ